ncbi:MAG: transposase [Desulfobacteraceae bacterium]|nr:transposase [Desulfobacteraceae bacterium]
MVILSTVRDDRQFKALTGVSQEQFEKLRKFFAGVYEEMLQNAYEEAVGRGERKRKRGGGRKGSLPTVGEKLFFVLYYLKVYPTFDVLASAFGMSRSKACENLHKIMPILHETLRRIGVVPIRRFESVEELKKVCEGIDIIIIDAVERAHRRPGDAEKQSSMYSGKKKGHTVKNTVISTPEKVILFVGQTFTGHNHDYKILKEEFCPDKPWFEDTGVLGDLGYQGIQKDYKGEEIRTPHKKPRKSKADPKPELNKEQKEENRALAKVRVYVEHAIGGMKRYNILNHPFRNMKDNFVDDVIAVCAGLWNMILPVAMV